MSTIRYCRLSLPFDNQIIAKDIEALHKEDWLSHLNTEYYNGNWDILSFIAPGGKNISIADSLNDDKFIPTPLLAFCPNIQAFLESFQCPLKAVRLMKLGAGALIKKHRDYDLAFEQGEARIHIPLQTNSQVRFILDDDLISMKTGDCWYINANLEHSVENPGKTDRIHLVIDCEVNAWLNEFFDNSPYKEVKQLNRDVATDLLIIENLYLMNTPTSIALATQMEEKINHKQ